MILFLKTLNYTAKIRVDELKSVLKIEIIVFVLQNSVFDKIFNNFELKY
jgi:hypothetical protein